MKSELERIKCNFDASINHLDEFYTLINSINLSSQTNLKFELYQKSVKDLNLYLRLYLMQDFKIDKIVSGAKLYLDLIELKRFYAYAKDFIKVKQRQLEQLVEQCNSTIRKELNIEFEKLFFENFTIGIAYFPKIGSTPNNDFVYDLVLGIKKYFREFEKEIDNIKSIYENDTFSSGEVKDKTSQEVIIESLTNIDTKGWEYVFVSEKDFNKFTYLLTLFFENKLDSIPEITIPLTRNCKTRLGRVLGEIHKKLCDDTQLSKDKKYFELIRILSHFRDEHEHELYKKLTR
ncbi:hypothetical protein [Flectobacillus major]|uniref:hypothetical protein n=1 Tax=Flectobacillus major TaxID=103 RepID=UPI0004055806|nr:hypothetical protein [Flectobacillus major]